MWTWVKRMFLVALLLVALPLLAGFGILGAGYAAGTLQVRVEDEAGHRFGVPLPAGLIPIALRFVPREVSEEACGELRREVGPQWPALRVAVEELGQIPDSLLVDVRDGEEHVRVFKRGDALFVEVRQDEELVAVSAPVHTLRQVVASLEATCEDL